MKPLRITLFVIAFVTLTSQTFRHAYVLWLEPRTSVLDKYDTPTNKQILAAKSLDELLALYDAAHAKAEHERETPPKTEAEGLHRTNADIEPFKSEAALRSAIQQWEDQHKEIHVLWCFWIAGLIALAIGSAVGFRSDRWISMALVILAFTEMVWATSPSFRSFGAEPEFDRLLVRKFVLSIASLMLLLLAWFMTRRAETK